MAKKKISKFIAATLPLSGTETVDIIQSGLNKKVPVSELPGSGGTTADSTIVATEGQTTFTFSNVPDNYDDYIIFVWGVAAEPELAYTADGNDITFASGLSAGDRVRFKRIK